MELNVTRLAVDGDLPEFSGSIAERGPNAARETWANANAEAAERPLIETPAQVQKVRDFFGEFGAWDKAERDAWTPTEVNALLVQYISGDLRELQSLAAGDGPGDIDWDEAEALSERGTCAGYLFSTAGEVYAYIGS